MICSPEDRPRWLEIFFDPLPGRVTRIDDVGRFSWGSGSVATVSPDGAPAKSGQGESDRGLYFAASGLALATLADHFNRGALTGRPARRRRRPRQRCAERDQKTERARSRRHSAAIGRSALINGGYLVGRYGMNDPGGIAGMPPTATPARPVPAARGPRTCCSSFSSLPNASKLP